MRSTSFGAWRVAWLLQILPQCVNVLLLLPRSFGSCCRIDCSELMEQVRPRGAVFGDMSLLNCDARLPLHPALRTTFRAALCCAPHRRTPRLRRL
jgi:hypothetical protein